MIFKMILSSVYRVGVVNCQSAWQKIVIWILIVFADTLCNIKYELYFECGKIRAIIRHLKNFCLLLYIRVVIV